MVCNKVTQCVKVPDAGSMETDSTYRYVWTTGAHGELEDSIHLIIQLTVEALDWRWLLVIADQRRWKAEVATQAFHVEH